MSSVEFKYREVVQQDPVRKKQSKDNPSQKKAKKEADKEVKIKKEGLK